MPQQRPIILVGGGGHCLSVIEAAESAGMAILGILDAPHLVGTRVLGHPVVGGDADMARYAAEADFIICVGAIRSAEVRRRLYAQVQQAGGRLGRIIASTARVSAHASIGAGTVVLHHALVNAGAVVGENCIINSGAIVEHGCNIGAHVHLSTGAVINGDCSVGDGSFVGSRAVVYQGCRIAERCVVAAGSVVRGNLDAPGLYAGNPAICKSGYEK